MGRCPSGEVAVCKTSYAGSIPVLPSNQKARVKLYHQGPKTRLTQAGGKDNKKTEMWQSLVYCSSLENCRPETAPEFESQSFR